ncbi:MAG: histidine kinase [Propionicimonas sp.]|uniref:sensor histidine kinase n=1 Tax=Propionicimonas sp. TaxID=1955623 RepID=UPI003D0C8A5F
MLLLDLLACAAALSARSSPLAGAALVVAVAMYMFAPMEWETVGEFALLIPILGAGMAGQHAQRVTLSLVYLLVAAGISWVDPRLAATPLGSWLVWLVLIATTWLIGDALSTTSRAEAESPLTIIVRHNRAIARSLHDTLARSLTSIALIARRSLLQGPNLADDLDLLADSADNAIDELRALISDLHVGSAPTRDNVELSATLARSAEALRSHGFSPALDIQGDPSRIPTVHTGVLARATQEAVHNMIKHGHPGPCSITGHLSETRADLAFTNQPAAIPITVPQRHVHLGLQELRHDLDALGGRIDADDTAEQWTTRIHIPAATTPPAAR